MFKRNLKAFSLIELSIIITVLSIIIIGFISISTSKVSSEKNSVTNNNIDAIYKALQKYLLVNKSLPCPASLKDAKSSSSTYGQALTTSNCVGTGVYQSTSSTNLVYGMAPIQTLGLDNSFAEDAYGNKIIYVVDSRLTSTASSSFENSILESSEGGSATYTHMTVTGSTSDAIFILMSRGANSSNAFLANSATAPSTSSDSNELSNDVSSIVENTYPTASTSTFDSTFIKSASSTAFDDVVFYKTRDELFNESSAFGGNGNSAWSVVPCSSFVETLYGTTVTWPKAYLDQIITANTQCPSPNWRGSVNAPTKKCGAKGVWGTTAVNPCTCSTGYSGTSCTQITCTFSGVTGIADGTSVAYGTSTRTCDSGYSGSVNYTCSGSGSPTINSGSCSITACTGGTVSTVTISGTTYTLNTLTSSGTLSCVLARTAQVLVVGGGGGGSPASGVGGGGGGGGGVQYSSSYSITANSTMTVTVGSGGSASANGSSSSFGTITAYGGGAGGPYVGPGRSGASSGGGSCDYISSPLAATQGNIGSSSFRNSYGSGGGGGGAGTAGVVGYAISSSVGAGGTGGDGASNQITGSTVYYGAGGGGGANTNSTSATGGGLGGLGGGGNGGRANRANGTSGTANTGSGGGGGECEGVGGSGGSGIVIVRYAN